MQEHSQGFESRGSGGEWLLGQWRPLGLPARDNVTLILANSSTYVTVRILPSHLSQPLPRYSLEGLICVSDMHMFSYLCFQSLNACYIT